MVSMETDRIITGDCLNELQELPENSVHTIVTDPPYGLAFMSRSWDDFDPKEYQEFCENWARRCRRVLKPGGHLLAFSGNRTHHRLFTGVEDAGFEIRDTLTWHYGSGFPKAADISKTIDKREGAEREEYENPLADKQTASIDTTDYGDYQAKETVKPEPATDKAQKWDGWKTGLKPATEYVVMARKPFDGATVDCVLEHGTAALNIDDCRIDTDGRPNRDAGSKERPGKASSYDMGSSEAVGETTEGRYPSNVIFDETEAERLDSKNDESASVGGSDASRFTMGV